MNEQSASPAVEFEQFHGRLFSVAYRMLGSRMEAEDVVQEAYIRWHKTDREAVRTAEAWLVTTVTRLAIDRLRALKTEREAYIGPWLPEPLLGDVPPPPDRHAELASDLSVAFLVLLERLAPEERAAFLLHDVFERDYDEIARAVGKSESACRQMVHRARERVHQDRTRFQVTEAARARLLRTFTAAVEAKDAETLLGLFSRDATWTSDGGGRTVAARREIVGAERIVKLVLGLTRLFAEARATIHLGEVNGETGLLVRVDGVIRSAWAITTDGERIAAVHAIVNPEKLDPTTRVH